MTHNVIEKKEIEVEICCGDLASVLAAKEGGAKRIELCCGLSEGGLTPSAGLIEAAVSAGFEAVNVLIRPRPGDFLYSEKEVNMMLSDIRTALNIGATGVVVGALSPQGNVDCFILEKLVSEAREIRKECYVTFHRAFDVSADAKRSLEDIIGAGCDCVLTSGMALSAAKGVNTIAKLQEQAGGRILVMAGCGVTPGNAADIIRQAKIGAIHSTARRAVASGMSFRRGDVAMGANGTDEYSRLVTHPDAVNSLISIANSF